MVGDGERIPVLVVAELELAFEVGAPEAVRRYAGGARSRLPISFGQFIGSGALPPPPPPPPVTLSPIPTLSEWALYALASLIGLWALKGMRRKRA